MINLEDCVQLGLLTRPHGIKGHMVLKLKNLSFEEIEQMELVYLIIDGLPVPFFIEEFSERSEGAIIIKLDDIISETEARIYSEVEVYIDRNILLDNTNSNSTNPFHLIGYEVIDDKFGHIGILDSLLEYDKNPVLRILKERKEILIPFHLEFIQTIDDTKKEILVNCPDGLLDLYI